MAKLSRRSTRFGRKPVRVYGPATFAALSRASRSFNKKLSRVATKPSLKRSRSVTRVKATTKRRKPNGWQAADAGASRSTFTKVNRALKRAKYSNFATNLHRYTSSFANIGNSARQTAFFLPYWEYTSVNKFVATLWNQVPATMDASTTAVVNQVRPYFRSCTGCYTFANLGTSTVVLRLFDVHCKVSTGDDPIATWRAGEQLEEADTSGYINNDFPLEANPTASKRFKQYWGIDQVDTVVLRGGEQHKHYIKNYPHKTMENSYLQSTQNRVALVSGTLPYIGRLTRGLLWTQQGTIDKDVSGLAGITTSSTETGVVLALNYKYQLLNWPSMMITTDLRVAQGTGTGTFINEATDAVTTNILV